MNKYVVTLLIVLTCILTACGYRDSMRKFVEEASGRAVSGGGSNMERESGRIDSAVSDSAVSGMGTHPAENVTVEMQKADLWIAKTVSRNRVLMSAKEIGEFNQKMVDELSKNEAATYYNLHSFGDSVDGQFVQGLIQRTDYSQKTYYHGENEVAAEEWESYAKNCAVDTIADSVGIRYGIICSRADVRERPTMDNVTDARGDLGHDVLQLTALAVNEPVLVLHTSMDGKWFYVVANEYAGWVSVERVGLCADREEWQKAQEMDDFIVVLGDSVAVENAASSEQPRAAGYVEMTFTMGTKLAIAGGTEYDVEFQRRSIYDNYVVKVPVRSGRDGTLAYQQVLVPLGKDVSHGYMEYTRANVLGQAFKLLGNPYGWGGMDGARDCSSMIRDIYLCFGFRLPRDASTQALIPSKGRVELSGLSDKDRMAKIHSVQPGTILQMSNHVMVYLGCIDHHYYVISANGTFAPNHDDTNPDTDSAVANYRTRLVTVNDLNVKSPSNGKTWMEQLATIVGLP